jgi:seryl-tRNA synthetase
MLDANFVTENRTLVEEGIKLKPQSCYPPAGTVEKAVALNEERKKLTHEVDTVRHEAKELSTKIGQAMKAKDPQGETLKARSKELKDREKQLADRQRAVEDELRTLLLLLPNLPHKDGIKGGPEANTVRRTWGTRRTFDFEPKMHEELALKLGLADLGTEKHAGRGAKVAGSGFVVYRGLGAKLERSLINWMLDLHVREHGYTEVSPPFVVNTKTMTGTGQLPKFSEELYQIERDDLWLIPTAEVPVTNLYADEILPNGDIPIAHCAYTPCFRREAGAAGKMTRGLRRVHQFDKVELVRFVHPEQSDAEHQKLLAHCTKVLELLGLEHRVLELASGDTGFSAARCYDLECWAPASKEWLEVSSVSTFTDFQARRANLRFRDENGKTRFLHTLNGSGVACPRVVLCILETYQRKDGTVEVPEVLRPYVGRDVLTV